MIRADLALDPETVRACKKPIAVRVIFATSSGEVQTLEGGVRHAAGDAILTGLRDEQWPVARKRFDRTYEPIPPTRSGQDGTYRRMPMPVWARRLRETISVQVGRKHDTITGRPGDWLVQQGPEDFHIVAADIFAETYELL
jgi:hypothetical protein